MWRLLGPTLLVAAIVATNLAIHDGTGGSDIHQVVVSANTPTTTATTSSSTTVPERTAMWARLADCESGAWDRHRRPVTGSRRWDDRRGGYEGGLHFAPSTWDENKAPSMPDSAADANAVEQVWVGERVLRRQGPSAWPVCSKKVGLR